MRERYLLYFIILFFSIFLTSFKWPVKNGIITSTFGESRGDHFHDGIDMIVKDDKIYPVDSGEVLYYWDKSIFPMEKTPGGGNYIILTHNNNKYYSLYLHLKNIELKNNSFTGEELLAIIGNSGHSFAKHLHFSILKTKNWSSFNPFLEMPKFNDDKPPKIDGFFLKIYDRYIQLRNSSSIRLTKNYPLLIKIVDTISGKERLGIYKLIVEHNDKEILNNEFKNIDKIHSILKVNSKGFSDVFDDKDYYKVKGISYVAGDNKFKITALDFNGNSSSEIFTLKIDLDME